MVRYSNVLEMVGRTPLLEVTRIDTGPCRLFLKLELMNPGGSIKDRIGISMIEEAEKRGEIRPGDTLVEATAGNTGIGLALVAGQKGYRLILVLPDKMSQEKIFNLRAMGAEIVLTRSDVGKGHPEYYQDLARRIAAERGAYYINQFGNPDNPRAHEETTAPEIWEQMEGHIDAFVAGVGSGGTLAGVGQRILDCVEAIVAAGVAVESLRVSGKLTRLNGLVALLADLGQLPVEVAAEEETGLTGISRLATAAPTTASIPVSASSPTSESARNNSRNCSRTSS